jgi:hypothetical protein
MRNFREACRKAFDHHVFAFRNLCGNCNKPENLADWQPLQPLIPALPLPRRCMTRQAGELTLTTQPEPECEWTFSGDLDKSVQNSGVEEHDT